MAGTKSNGTEFSVPTFRSIAVIFLALARLGGRVRLQFLGRISTRHVAATQHEEKSDNGYQSAPAS